MIFEGKDHPPIRIGICPVCDKESEVADTFKGIEKEILCSNEYYHHYISDGISYIYKRKNPKDQII